MSRAFIVTAVLVTTLAFASAAFAWTHGQFTATTDACAGCHVAHAAEAPKLLKAGPTQTHFCYLCHGDGTASAPYDIKDGYTSANGGTTKYVSTAGGFERCWDGSAYKTNTSRHNVQGFVLGDESGGVTGDVYNYLWIPGGTNQLTGSGFVCGSCHDPHAGGKAPATVSWQPPGSGSAYSITSAVMGNPRLLRTSIFDQTVDTVIFKMATVGTYTYEGVTSGVYRVTEYVYGSSAWCGACHDKFDTSTAGDRVAGEGHAGQYLGMWRHPMDVHAVLPDGSDGTVATGTPLEIWTTGFGGLTDKVACLTCHRAHGSPVQKAGWASNWPRDGGGTSDTSALLRMDNRGTCYNCHRAGEYNCWTDPRFNCGDCHPGGHSGGGDCVLCHR
jgi:predicted CXXCH cytochrome family protein